MKKIIFLILFGMLFLPQVLLAAPNINVYTEKIAVGSGYEKATDTTLSETIGKYIKIALSFVGTIFLVITVYAGFLWMTASGNEDQVSKAKDMIQMATIGLIVALAAFSITAFVVSRVGSTSQSQTPVGGATGPQAAGEDPVFWESWWGGVKKQADTAPLGEPK